MDTTSHLDKISNPTDLAGLDADELAQLAEEIRERIVTSVEANGGHLGSNLGIVELTIALHRTFDSPRDVILWDTGHQAYVHKLLTGRSQRFDELRLPGGLSGYPSREESEHDWIENSHASTALSYAHGLATAFEAKGEDRRVIAVVGDGSLTGGMAFEGLNNLGHSGRRVVVILNDNGRSYAPTISRLGESLVKIRTNPKYMRRQARVEGVARKLPGVGDLARRSIEATKAAIRTMWQPPAFFENLGVRYVGPIDGHDIAEMEEVLANVAEFDGPTVVHVLTQKGRGYAPAENDPIKNMHDLSKVKPGSYTQAYAEAMVKVADENPDIVAITAAMPDSTGLLPFRDRFPDRFHDVGIAEQHAITMATGLALGGMRPVVALYATFLSRAFDQVNLDAALHGQPVVLCLDRAGITGDDGASHHGIIDMVLLSKVPGITMFAPSSYQELQVMLADAMDITGGPVSIRWPKTAAPSVTEAEVGAGLSGRRVRSGTDVCIVGVGKMLAAAAEAADILAAEGISATVWDPRVVRPLDAKMITDAAHHPLIVTVEDGLREGGIGMSIRDEIEALGSSARVRVLGVPTAHIPHGNVDDILTALGLDGHGVAATIRAAL